MGCLSLPRSLDDLPQQKAKTLEEDVGGTVEVGTRQNGCG